MMNIEHLKNLVFSIQTTLDRDPREAIKYQFYEAVKTYIDEQLVKTKGVVTQDILAEIDTLYDVPGNPSRLADMLGLELKDLQDALGREREVQCIRCQKLYVILERRRIGGYTEISNYTCKNCHKIEWEGIKNKDAAREAKILQNIHMEAIVDFKIRRANNPLRVLEYKSYLLNYLICWKEGNWEKFTYTASYSFPNIGCMFCGRQEVFIYVTRNNLMEEGTVFYEIAHQTTNRGSAYKNYGHLFPLLETYHQTLWRLSPDIYFSYFPDYPIIQKPLLCLCLDCGASVESTHVLVENE